MTEQLIPDNLPDDVRWGFTRAGLLYVRHHFHWIAVTKGIARSNLAKHWPELVWNDLMFALKAAKVWKKDPEHFSGKDLQPEVKEFHILHDDTFRVRRLKLSPRVVAETIRWPIGAPLTLAQVRR